MPDYAVSTAFTAKDQGIIDAYERMGRAADDYGDRAGRAFRKVGEGADHASTSLRNATKHGYNFGAILKGVVAANMIHGAVGMVTHAIKSVGEEYLTFDDEMTQAVAKFSDLGPNVKGFENHVLTLGKTVRKVGVESKFPLEQLAAGMNQIARSKIFDSTAAPEALQGIMKLNVDAMGDFREATKGVMGMMGAWAFKTDNARETMSNYKMMLNALAVAANSSQLSLSDMAETMESVGPNARKMGYGFKDVTAMMTFLGKAGIHGDKAATGLRNMFQHMARPDFIADLAKLGAPVEVNGKFRPIRDWLTDIDKLVRRFSQVKGGSFLDVLFGMRGSAAGNDLIRQLGEYGKLEDEFRNDMDSMDKIYGKINNSKLNRWERFKNKLTDKTWQIFDQYADNFSNGINKMMAAVDKFDMKPLIQALDSTGYILGIVYRIAAPFLPLLPWIAAGFTGIKIATAAITWGPLVAGFVMTALEATKVLGVLNLLRVAWLTLNASFIGTPLGAFALAVTGLGAAGYSLFTGRDNPISRLAQDAGIVPRLDTDSDGQVIGRRGAAENPDVGSVRRGQPGVVTVRFENAPAGTTVTKSSNPGYLHPGIETEMLGVNY